MLDYVHGRTGKVIAIESFSDIKYFLIRFKSDMGEELVIAHENVFPDKLALSEAAGFLINFNVYFDAVNNVHWLDADDVWRATSVWRQTKLIGGLVENEWPIVKEHYKAIKTKVKIMQSLTGQQVRFKDILLNRVAKEQKAMRSIIAASKLYAINNNLSALCGFFSNLDAENREYLMLYYGSDSITAFCNYHTEVFNVSRRGNINIKNPDTYFSSNEFFIKVYNRFEEGKLAGQSSVTSQLSSNASSKCSSTNNLMDDMSTVDKTATMVDMTTYYYPSNSTRKNIAEMKDQGCQTLSTGPIMSLNFHQ